AAPSAEEARTALLDLYRQVREGKRVREDVTDPLQTRLKLAGVVRVAGARTVGGGTLSVRNRIYTLVFNRAWVAAHMPDAEVRRQRAAFRRGLGRATAVASLVLAALAG